MASLTCLPTPSFAQPILFGPNADYATGTSPYSVAVGDVNRDAQQDVVVANRGSNTVSVFLGNGDATFGPRTDVSVGSGPSCVQLAYLNADNNLDLVVVNTGNGNVSVLLGDGNGGFGTRTDFPAFPFPLTVAVGDLNHDGYQDLVVGGDQFNAVAVLLGNGDGTFLSRTLYSTGETSNAISIGNLNGDAHPDLAVGTGTGNTNRVAVLIGNGDGTFALTAAYDVAANPFAVAIGDFNADSNNDLAIAGSWSGTVSILLGDGMGDFSARTDFSGGGMGMTVTDFNGDNMADIGLAQADALVLAGMGNGAFGPPSHFTVGVIPISTAGADFNSDGKPDLAVANSSSNTLSILLNQSLGVFPPPFVLKWGSYGTEHGQFVMPLGVAADPDGNILVADTRNHRVQKFTPNGGFLSQLGGPGDGDGQFASPHGVAVDNDGYIYVSEQGPFGHNRVQKFASDGQFVQAWLTIVDGFDRTPFGIAVDNQGYVYVAIANTGGRLIKYTDSGQFVTEWGQDPGPGQLLVPQYVAADGLGHVYVTDGPGTRVKKFTSTGQFITTWGHSGSADGEFNGAYGITVGANGNVYVADVGNFRIQEFTGDGHFLTKWGSQGTGPDDFGYYMFGITTDADGNVYITDTGQDCVHKFGPATRLRPVVLVHGICSDGNMWSEVEPYLSQDGFDVHVVDFTDRNARPQDEATDFKRYLDSTFPNEDVDVIAHSMGGLVCREYIARQADNNQPSHIRTLVTLGTPHHGCDLYRFTTQLYLNHPRLALLLAASPLGCRTLTEAARDLKPGSRFLNGLNYGAVQGKWDKSNRPSWEGACLGQHCSEDVRDNSVRFVALAGTGGMCPLVQDLLNEEVGNIWKGSDGTVHENDGAVARESSILYNVGAEDHIDRNIGLGHLSHSAGPSFVFCNDSYTESMALSQDMSRVLRGVVLSGPTGGSTVNKGQAVEGLESSVALTQLPSVLGQLGPGSTSELPFEVPPTTSLRILGLVEDAGVRLRKPDGTVLNSTDTLTVPGLKYAEVVELGLKGFTVAHPDSGTWNLIFDGASSVNPEDVEGLISVESSFVINVGTVEPVIHSDGAAQVIASADSLGSAVVSVTWDVTVIRPGGTTFPILLYDDGAHGDGIAADGHFGGSFEAAGPLGFYRIDGKASVHSNNAVYLGSSEVELATYHDLAVEDLPMPSQNSVQVGDVISWSAPIHNLGAEAVSELSIEFWDNQTKFATVPINLGAGETKTVETSWTAATPDTHTIRIVADPFKLADEVNYENNSTGRQVALGRPIVGVGDGPTPVLWLGSAVPNPSRNSVMFRFSIPSRSKVAFGIYDVLGRRIKQWQWEDLPAGRHSLEWRGSNVYGRQVPAGVYFYRLSVGERTLTHKVIRIQ